MHYSFAFLSEMTQNENVKNVSKINNMRAKIYLRKKMYKFYK